MGIINVTITASADQTLPGIPNTVSITTNEPASIFYTLDGSVPNTYSPIYVSPILMPQALLVVTLNVFATNQIDSSAIITQVYTANIDAIPTAAGDRLPRSAVTNLNNSHTSDNLFPYGTGGPTPDFQYLNPSKSGTTVYNQALPATPSGFDANGKPDGYTNQPLVNFQFKQVYSTVNSEGAVTPGVGNLPAKVTVLRKETPNDYSPERSSFSDKIFNPRALVIFQDSTTEDPTNPVNINRPYFSLEDQEVVRDGNLLYNSTLDSPPTMGGFVNRHYNARTNMMTHSYYDNTVGRWIFSTFPYQPTTPNVGALYQMVFSRAKTDGTGGAGFVFKWLPFYYRTLI
jgi:hypothetical protein